eukprot:CAMPEP_0172816904 /NCGR_PEP_ID=MMETSP1075-20121228/12806_1 /TAXON_ID=2916 /ORGANISM="Ceratium fusus, Strain PA161109" /LENGTH=112 /DNA_ID=CAMNT_0013656985 /DNA_START=392 /DNA_END=731 /DNA_ORIENTATION=+
MTQDESVALTGHGAAARALAANKGGDSHHKASQTEGRILAVPSCHHELALPPEPQEGHKPRCQDVEERDTQDHGHAQQGKQDEPEGQLVQNSTRRWAGLHRQKHVRDQKHCC